MKAHPADSQYPPPGEGAALRDRLRGRLAAGLAGALLRSPRRLRAERPIATFSFDGAARSSYLLGAALVEKAGGRAVFYTETGALGGAGASGRRAEPGDIRDLHLRGHEVALHGHRPAGPRAPDHDIARNRAALQDIHPGIAAENFAYPAPLLSLRQKAAVARLTSSSRGCGVGVNAGVFDSQWLRGAPLDGSLTAAELRACLDRAGRLNGWVIFSTGEISDRAGARACPPATLKAALDACLARGFDILTVAEALRASEPAPLWRPDARRDAASSNLAAWGGEAEPAPSPAGEFSGAALGG